MTALKPTKKSLLPPINRQSYIPIAFMVLAVTQVLFLFGFVSNSLKLSKLANQRPSTMVQLVNGKSIVARAHRYDYRDPRLLQTIAQEWVTLTYSWGAPRTEQLMELPGESITGFSGPRGLMPMTTAVASHLLTPDGRDEFINGFSEDVFKQAYKGNQISTFQPLQVLEPEKTDKGWLVEIIGERHITTPDNEVGILHPVHLEIYLIASEISDKPMVSDATALEKEVYRLLQSGIRIEKVVSLGT